jgi:serine/threonine protein kinase
MQPSDPRLNALREALAGRVLRGSAGISYHLRERIGEGGQGWVFKANWGEANGFIVIVKVLRPDAVTQETLTRFQREAEVLRMLSQTPAPNAHIVRFFDHATAEVAPPGTKTPVVMPYTVLEYVNGPTLEQVQREQKGLGLPVDRVRRVLRHVTSALEHVHAQKIVHRDLKPSNILLAQVADASGATQEVAKVTDFGLVKVVAINLARTTALAGASLGYAPPEQYEQGNQRVGTRTDVFSLAAITYEMLTGQKSFPYKGGENPLLIVTRILNGPRPSVRKARATLAPELQQRGDLVDRLDAEIVRATSADPAERHESAATFHAAIDAVLRTVAPEPRAQTPAPSAVPITKRAGSGGSGGYAAVSSSSMSSEPHSTHETAIPTSIVESLAANPAHWAWRIASRPIAQGTVKAAAFATSGNDIVGVGPGGLARWSERRGWVAMTLPAGVEAGRVRGLLWARNGDVILSGEGGLAGRIAQQGPAESWSLPDRDVSFLGAHRDEDGAVTFVGERKARGTETTGLLAQMVEGRLAMVCDANGCARLRAAARLRNGPIVACGDRGAVVKLENGGVQHAGSVCGGHLNAIAATSDGGALTVGAGGHALSISPRLEAQLEAVQTTRDLRSLAIAEDGVAWAGAAGARLLRRSSGSWVRMSGDLGVTAAVVAIWAAPRTVRAVCDDGAVIEGTLS